MRPKLVWSLFGAVAAVVALVAFLATRRRHAERVTFPPSPKVTRLAIRAPLVRPDLSVMATLQADARATPVFMTVDSVATGVTLPEPIFHGLALDVLRNVTVRQEDPTGRVIVRAAGEVPRMSLGPLELPLVLEDVLVAIGGGATVLGQSVLAHSPWEIDWDRGVLTLGATPWLDDGATTFVPIRRVGDAEVVTLQLDGAPIDMVLDTGAFTSILPERVGAAAGLSVRRIAPTVLHSAGGEMLVRRVFTADARLGASPPLRLELASIASGGRRAALGLLGLDVLSRFHVQVVPGVRLGLRPRADVHATRSERIGRWSFVPTSCAHLGCVEASLAATGEDAELTLALEADLDREVEFLLGCAGDHAPVPTDSSFGLADPWGTARHVRVRLPSRARGTVAKTTIPNGARWFAEGGADCHVLEALDLSPLSPIEGAAPLSHAGAAHEDRDELQASYWP